MNDKTNSLESRINDLRRDVDDLLTSSTRRTRKMRIVLMVVCIAMIGYTSFIYSKLSEINSDLVVSYAQAKVQEQIADGGKHLAATLNAKAPEIFDDLQSRVVKMPDMLAKRGRNLIAQRLDAEIPKIEADMTAKMLDLIDRLADKAYEGNKGEMNEGDFQELMDAVAVESVNSTLAMFDSFHATYQQGSDQVIEYIDELAAGKNLGNREKHHRNILLAALAVIEKKAAESKASMDDKPKLQRPAATQGS